MSTGYVDRFRVRHSLTNVAGDRSSMSFCDRLHDRVVDGLLSSLVLRNIHRIVDRLLLGLPNRNTDGVRDGLRVS